MSAVILGLGRYVEDIIEIVSKITDIVLVEQDEDKIKTFLFEENIENLRVIKGNATDIELWRENIELDKLEAVISFLDEEKTLDIAKVLRKIFYFTKSIIFVAKERPESKEFKELKVEIISVPDVLGSLLKTLLKGEGLIRYPIGIGLRKGEVAEVYINETSPAVYMRISDLRLRNVRIALIYRENKVILPRTDIRISPGDRLLVVGEPSYVELFVKTVTRGEPNFPLRWGTKAYTCKVSEKDTEILYLKEKLKVREWIFDKCEETSKLESAGLVVFGKKSEGFLRRNYIDEVFLYGKVPSIFLGKTYPYEKILVSANTEALGFLLPSAIDFARLFNSKIYIIYVTNIEKMMTKEEKEHLESLKKFLDRTKKILNAEISLIRREGNPVRETIKVLQGDFNVLVLGYTPGRISSFFNPYIPHILAQKSDITTLLIPEANIER